MKINTTDKGEILLTEVYSGVLLETDDKETIGICMRDTGFEFNYNGVWYEAKQGIVREMKKEEPKQETLEYGLLQHIKMCLECNNESQAIRLLEKYGFEKQEGLYSEEEVHNILDSNDSQDWSSENNLDYWEWFKQFEKK